ncbi:MAG: arginase family protein [Candidatus Omnitrophota bacterium]|nr:arginase family protein [Candidatus Omnitrophota bacterium]
MKFVYAGSTLKDAEFVIIGVDDEKGSHAMRAGARKGPDAIRKIAFERCVFKRKGKFNLAQVESGRITKSIHDYGNVSKKKLARVIEMVRKDEKIPVILGGDHSITTEALKSLKDVTMIYFDAHPDIVSSMHGNYGSVLGDVEIDLGKTVEIGVREPEIEELKSIKKERLHVVYAEDFFKRSLEDIWKEIKSKVKGKVYLSIDLDVLDPAYAPGVSTPVPGGLNYNQTMYMVKKIVTELEVIGFDVMELNPRYDKDEMTAHLAAKMVLEMIFGHKKKIQSD